jgi:rubrerythrin
MSGGRDMTRASFLAGSAVTAGALSAGPWVASALAHAEHQAFGGGDVGIVNFALTLEKIEAEFYKRALAVQGLEPDVKKLLEAISKNEAEHVQSLTQSLQGLGGKPDPAPAPQFPPLTNQREVIQFAATLEDTGVWAYNGAATQLVSKDLLQAIASIGQVEARHAAALRVFDGKPPTESAFDAVFSGEQADDAIHELTTP